MFFFFFLHSALFHLNQHRKQKWYGRFRNDTWECGESVIRYLHRVHWDKIRRSISRSAGASNEKFNIQVFFLFFRKFARSDFWTKKSLQISIFIPTTFWATFSYSFVVAIFEWLNCNSYTKYQPLDVAQCVRIDECKKKKNRKILIY